jgi:hypothetical protein
VTVLDILSALKARIPTHTALVWDCYGYPKTPTMVVQYPSAGANPCYAELTDGCAKQPLLLSPVDSEVLLSMHRRLGKDGLPYFFRETLSPVLVGLNPPILSEGR